MNQPICTPSRNRTPWLLVASLAFFLLLVAPSVAQAQGTIDVDTVADEFGSLISTGCSLREAIESANSDTDFGGCVRVDTTPYTITVPTGLYTLTLGGSGENDNAEGDLDLRASMTISGTGVNDTIIQAGITPGAGIDRIFHISGTVDVLISNVTMQNGVTEAGGSGGAILASAGSSLTVHNATIADSRSGRAGGAIELGATITNSVSVTLTDVVLIGNSTGDTPGNGGALHTTGPGVVHMMGGSVISNTAAAEGGGLWNSAVGTMVISGTTFSANTASGAAADQGGGALFNDGGTLMVSDVTLTDNVADGASGSGGGVLINAGGAFTMTNSMISGNGSNRAGGGIEVNATVTDTTSVTLSGVDFISNTTGSSPGNGGALHITGPGAVSVTGGSVISNTATAEGGGLWNSAVGTLTISDTVISANTASGADSDQGGGGLFNDGGLMMVMNTTIDNNRADGMAGSGGGILNNGGTLSITGGEISGNTANRAGGGIEDNARGMITAVTLENVDFTSNTTGSSPGNGGALHISGPGVVSVSGGSVISNTATAEGGGLWNSAVGTLTISNTVISANTASGADPDQGGGGLFNDGGALSVSNVMLTDNVADGASGSGGGVLINAGGGFTMTNSMISGNVSNRAGGGIEVNATITDTTFVTLDNVDFSDNVTGNSPGNGGALHITGPGDVSVSGGTVTNNTASAEGGGLWNSVAGTLTISATVISANTASGADADQGGGGLFNDGGMMMVTNAIISNNVADGAAGSGGGILNNGGTLSVSNSNFSDNTSNRAGGGIETNIGMVMLSNSDFNENSTGSSPGNGGALHVTGAGTVTVTGGTVSGNSAALEGGGFWNGSGTMTVDGTTFSANAASGGAADDGGGALFNNGGTLLISNADINSNSADGASGSGGGIFNNGGMVMVSESVISDNAANRAGGGIEDNAGMGITLSGVTLDGNETGSSPGNGGALHITGAGVVTITTSTVSNNVAAAEGGGLWNSAAGALTVSRTTLNGNAANGTNAENGGGALYNDGGVLNVSNSTVSGNSATMSGGGFNNTGTASVINVTLFENSAQNGAGGIANSGTLDVVNSIIAHDTAMGDDCVGVTAGEFNLASDGTCQAAITADPMLGPLQNNGGSTQTHALLADSPAIDAGDSATCTAPPIGGVDQRGVSRSIGTTCDLGAYEGGITNFLKDFFFPFIYKELLLQ